MKSQNIIKLIVALAVSLLAGAIGGLFANPALNTWYMTLAKPSFTPPNGLFVPVWIILYILMGVAAYLIWKEGVSNKMIKNALLIFLFQLVASVFWPIIFFGSHAVGLAFMEIISLWCAILATILSFYEIKRLAAYLMILYILWMTFMAILNYGLWRLL